MVPHREYYEGRARAPAATSSTRPSPHGNLRKDIAHVRSHPAARAAGLLTRVGWKFIGDGLSPISGGLAPLLFSLIAVVRGAAVALVKLFASPTPPKRHL
jgi:hypothetical protein